MIQPFPGRITAVVAQEKIRRHMGPRVNVFVDEKFSFALDAFLAHKFGLKPGKVLSATQLEEILREDGDARALARALHYLSYRPRSEDEVRKRLQRDEWPDSVIHRVLEKLKGQQLLGDATFATLWVESRSHFRPRGARALQWELRQKGVDKETIQAALPDADEEIANAVEALRRKDREWNRYDDAREREQKMIQFLQRRGFNYGTARQALRRREEE